MVTAAQQAAFKEWLRQQGGYVHPNISLFHQLPSGDRGVCATADIAEGEQLLLVPVACTLHLEVTDASGTTLAATCDKDLAAFLTQQQQQQPEDNGQQQQQQQQPQHEHDKPFSSFLATTLMLMAELAKGDASRYASYFTTLPASTDCLINWTAEEQQLLTGTSLADATRSIQDIFEADIAPRLATRPDLFPASCVSYQCFRRAADLVQTRAFHMSADNWLTGAHQESTDELYLIPAIDMLNHSTTPSQRNTSLSLCQGEVEVKLEGGEVRRFTNFFAMRAEKAIPAGTQVLHTYGDLSDAQLLQTYGFIDVPPHPQQQQQQQQNGNQQQQPAAAEQQQEQEEKEEEGGGLTSNPHNYVVLPVSGLLAAAKAVGTATRLWSAKKADAVLSKRLAHLASSGLLQQQQPEASQLLVTAQDPLPDELLTIVQVLMMTDSEFKQLQQAEQEDAQTAAAAAAMAAEAGVQNGAQQTSGAAGAAAAAGVARRPVSLNLGSDMLTDEFGELCGAVLLQAIDRWVARYPHDLRASQAAMQAAAPGSRPWLAAAVMCGEQQLLQQLKKGALMVMLGAVQEEGDEEDEGEEECELDSELDGEEEEEEEVEEEETATKQRAAAGTKRRRQQQQQEADEPVQHSSKQHKHAHKKKHKKQRAGRDDRPHYGDLTGPTEQEVWQSDDSDKVGYSSGSDSEDEGEERHPVDPSEHHTYEVAADGAVREAHGHMLGPDESALIESDDSDKVGYADEAQAAGDAAAAAGEAAGAGAADEAGDGKKERGGRASKKPKRGLGFKG